MKIKIIYPTKFENEKRYIVETVFSHFLNTNDFILEFSDKSKWSIRLLDLLSIRYNGEDVPDDDPFVKDEQAITEWVKTLAWDDVFQLAEEIKRPEFCPDYNEELAEAKVEIVPWDKSINLLDLFESTLNDDEQDLD